MFSQQANDEVFSFLCRNEVCVGFLQQVGNNVETIQSENDRIRHRAHGLDLCLLL